MVFLPRLSGYHSKTTQFSASNGLNLAGHFQDSSHEQGLDVFILSRHLAMFRRLRKHNADAWVSRKESCFYSSIDVRRKRLNFFVRCSRSQGSNVFLRRLLETLVEILLQILVRELPKLQRSKWPLQESVDSQNLLLCTTLLLRLGVSVGDQPICYRDLATSVCQKAPNLPHTPFDIYSL